MAWDTKLTRERLLAAATAEFNQMGLAGGRVDRIASAAGVNKERIYQYFGSKESLFDAVLIASTARTPEEVHVTGRGPAAIGEYAGRLFDRNAQDSSLQRLQFWEGLERGGHVVESEIRAQQWADKVGGLVHSLPGIGREAAADLLLTIVTLCDAWPVLQHVDALLCGEADDRLRKRRAFVIRTVTSTAESLCLDAHALSSRTC